jgi:NAD-dependent histone deacetylase SIR2
VSQGSWNASYSHRALAAMTITVELSATAADVHSRRILAELSKAVYKSKRIVVVTGAGISCSCGIPAG